MIPFALHLMRHGEPVLAGRLLGRTDCAVLAGGIAACRTRAATLSFERIVCSDLARADDCAQATGDRVTDRRWRELDFGDWDGLPPAAVDPAALAGFRDDPDGNPPPGGETWSMLMARVAEAIAALTPVPTLVVTHGGAMRAALAVLCGFDVARTWAFDLPYAAVLSLKVWPTPPRAAQIVALRT